MSLGSESTSVKIKDSTESIVFRGEKKDPLTFPVLLRTKTVEVDISRNKTVPLPPRIERFVQRRVVSVPCQSVYVFTYLVKHRRVTRQRAICLQDEPSLRTTRLR